MNTNFVVSCAALSVVAAGSVAGVTTWDDRGDFLNALAGLDVHHDDFETYDVDIESGARSMSLDGFDASYDGGNLFGIDDLVDLAHGVAPISGERYLRADFGTQSAQSLTFSFDGFVSDFGFYIRDLELTSLSYETDSGLSGVAGVLMANDAVQFFGLTTGGDESLAFSTITFTMLAQPATGEDGVAFDQLTYVSSPVPAPGSLALIGFSGLAMTRRRR